MLEEKINKKTIKLIHGYEIDGDCFKVQLNRKFSSQFFSEDFWMIVKDTDLQKVPLEILLVPFVLNVAPIVWASGYHFEIENLNKEFSRSLIDLKKALIEMYPKTAWKGEITVNNPIPSIQISKANQSVLLFSGGLDSLATSFNHIKERQTLVTIQGSDIKIDDVSGWEIVRDATIKHASEIDGKQYLVLSNFMDFVKHDELREISGIKDWWGFVQHGMGLCGFMAVPSWFSGASKAYIGSTHSAEFYNQAWGSHPKIDNLIKWNDTRVHHDCYHLTRQGKIEFLIKSIEEYRKPTPFLRVCYSSRGGKNCCFCEKCCRTINGLIIAGANFQQFGFPITSEQVIRNTRDGLVNNKFKFNENTLFHWEDLQSRINKEYLWDKGHSKEVVEHLFWLSDFGFKDYKRNQERKLQQKGRVIKIISVVPGLLPVLKHFKKYIKK